MADLFLELLSEEIPARLQFMAQENLKKLVTEEFLKVDAEFEVLECFSTPRRLILVIRGLKESILPKIEEKRGPNILAPKEAIEGFCKSLKIDRSQLFIKEEKKGKFYYTELQKVRRSNSDLLPEILSKVIRGFPWPKSMRWGSGSFKWVRPLHSIVCILSDDTESKILPLEFNGTKSSNVSIGHRVMAPETFLVKSFEDYQEKMRHRFVILDRSVRKEKILNDSNNIAFALGLELVEDKNLLDEVVGLVEWPVVLTGKIDEIFLTLPSKVLQVSMREHQKFFSLKDKDTNIINSFIVVANIVSIDNGESIIEGYERVLRARLSDARFFWENDLREIDLHGFDSFAKKLEKVTFHNKLGTEADRVKRLIDISVNIAKMINADVEIAKTASSLCKLDLVSEMVNEFPELQGVMGKYYAEKDGFHPEIAQACLEHYSPKGHFDAVPRHPISIVVALADKIDTICNLWSINLKPTGSKDPFALRRSSIGIIRILIENELELSLVALLELGNSNLDFDDLIEFFNERIRSQFAEKGLRSDVFNSLESRSDKNLYLTEMFKRGLAIQDFVSSPLGKNLIQGYRRTVNILNAEESKDGLKYTLTPQVDLFEKDSEAKLYYQLLEARKNVTSDLKKGQEERALKNFSELREPIDQFFNEVKINTENVRVRRNRLGLLNQIKEAMHQVADFSKIDDDF